MYSIHIFGIDQGLPVGGAAILAKCRSAFASSRLRPWLAGFSGRVHNLTPLAEALPRISEEAELGDVVVLASGDPLFFGIGRTLLNKFGREKISIHPGLSAVQLACARFKEPWDDAKVFSLHGRDMANFGSRLLRHAKTILFTDARHSPAMIAGALQEGLDRIGASPDAVQIMVAENLGLPDERLTIGSPAVIAADEFSDLNVVIIKQLSELEIMPASDFRLGLREDDLCHSRGLITKDEVRAATLHRLCLPSTGVFWDIGAGSGSIAIEAARLQPELEILAVEHNPNEQENIRQNIRRFKLANLTLIRGRAPDALADLPRPDRVFIGGSSGQLAAIIECAASRMSDHNGVVAVNAVTAATREAAPALLHAQGLRVELSTIQASRRSFPPAVEGVTDFKPITIITGRK